MVPARLKDQLNSEPLLSPKSIKPDGKTTELPWWVIPKLNVSNFQAEKIIAESTKF